MSMFSTKAELEKFLTFQISIDRSAISTIVDQHCVIIWEQGARVTTEQLKTLFDVFVSEFEKTNASSLDITLIKQITSILIKLPNKCQQLAEPELIAHQLMILLRDYVLIDQLRRRETIDIVYDILIDLSTLLANICRHISDTNNYLFKQLLFHKPLTDELSNCLDEIATSGQYLDNSQFLSSIGLLLTAFQRFEMKQTEKDESSHTTPLLFAVVKCLCSPYAVDALTGLEHNFSQNLTERQTFLLSTCSLYLFWFSGDRTPEVFLQIPRSLLSSFTTWAINCESDAIIHCSSELRDMMRRMNFALVRPVEWETANILSKEFNDDYCKLVSQWSSFLQVTVQHSSDEYISKSIARFIVQDLYNFTLHPSILNFMKSITILIPTLLKMTDIQQDETQLNTFRCLGKIMTEVDIKIMTNPSKIAMIYVKFLSNTIDDPRKKERFYSLLESLKNWVQHDQVKIDLVEQKALPLLVRSAMETKFDLLKAQKPALEILLALSFANDVSSYLKGNQKFMSYIRNLLSNTDTDKASLQRAAEALFWKLEKEREAVAKPTNSNSYQYDIMISYSHTDQQLCHAIYEQLIKDGFRVWIDREDMHGATMVAMANAIENSNVILIFMSDAYKQSVYCQSEAHYAFERRRRLVPLIMEPRYKPDGWLGIIVSGKIYIHFAKIEFNLAYEQLKAEISQHRRQNTNQLIIKTKEKDHQHSFAMTIQSVEKPSQSILQYPTAQLPHCISQWTHEHVKSFFISIGLQNTLLILCVRMDGHHLLQLYEICMINRESMFQSLKAELVEERHKLLPIGDYVTFLREIKKYVPLTSTKFRTAQSDSASFQFCSVM